MTAGESLLWRKRDPQIWTMLLPQVHAQFFIFERLLLFSELGSERNRKIGFFAHLIYDRKSGRQRTPKVGGDGCTTVKQPLHQGKHIKEEASIPCNGIIEVRYWLQASAEKPLLDLKSIRIIEEQEGQKKDYLWFIGLITSKRSAVEIFNLSSYYRAKLDAQSNVTYKMTTFFTLLSK